MGITSRRKGARGQSIAKQMLEDRDFICDQITAGVSAADLIATDIDGKTWAVEVKNCATITVAHKKQAIDQGERRRLPWMLMSKIQGSTSWLIQRQGDRPTVWHEKSWQEVIGGDE